MSSVMAKIQGICFRFVYASFSIRFQMINGRVPGFIKQSEVSIKFKDWIVNYQLMHNENVNETKMNDIKTA